MKRVIASLAMAVGLLLTAAPAQASSPRECTEILIHFRPNVCTDESTGGLWVCPDGPYWCVQIFPIPV